MILYFLVAATLISAALCEPIAFNPFPYMPAVFAPLANTIAAQAAPLYMEEDVTGSNYFQWPGQEAVAYINQRHRSYGAPDPDWPAVQLRSIRHVPAAPAAQDGSESTGGFSSEDDEYDETAAYADAGQEQGYDQDLGLEHADDASLSLEDSGAIEYDSQEYEKAQTPLDIGTPQAAESMDLDETTATDEEDYGLSEELSGDLEEVADNEEAEDEDEAELSEPSQESAMSGDEEDEDEESAEEAEEDSPTEESQTDADAAISDQEESELEENTASSGSDISENEEI